MAVIKFPYRAKVDGVYYEPGTKIKVSEADVHVSNGAVVVEEAAAVPQRQTKKKTAKSASVE